MTDREWIEAFAGSLGVDPPGDDEIAAILELAGEAAHSSQRTAAPVACWIGAAVGLSPAQALERARSMAGPAGAS